MTPKVFASPGHRSSIASIARNLRRPLLPAATLCLVFTLRAQTNTFPASGDAGIGTASPGGALQIANNGPEWSVFNFGTNLIVKDGAVARHPTIGLFDANNNNPWGITNVFGDLWFNVMPSLGNTSVAPVTQLIFKANGNVGIGNATPSNALVVGNDIGATVYPSSTVAIGSASANSGLTIGQSSTNRVRATWAYNATPASAYMVFGTVGGANPIVLQDQGGTVGIGTTDPCASAYAPANCKLSVAGAIQAQEIVVNTGWSDYVFDPAYHLRPLTEVAAYIQENHHLPEIPSEAEVKEKGVSLGEMQSKLLAKVEELTLHMIAADERSRQADERNKALEQQNREMRERIARLESSESGTSKQK